MKESRFLIIVTFSLVVFLVVFEIYQYFSKPQLAYINIKQVFEKFEMKKELEKKFSEVKNSRQVILDSLMTELQLLSKKIERDEQKNKQDIDMFEVKRQNYMAKKKGLDSDNQALSDSYDQQIITQLRQYVRDYGIQQKYSIIFGDDNNGIVMYAENSRNISNQVISYINEKYQGK